MEGIGFLGDAESLIGGESDEDGQDALIEERFLAALGMTIPFLLRRRPHMQGRHVGHPGVERREAGPSLRSG
jgi:hypothetical protein